MFTLTAILKKFAVEKLGVKADATDAVFLKAIGDGIKAGKTTILAVKAMAASTPKPVVKKPAPAAISDAAIDAMLDRKLKEKMEEHTRKSAPAPQVGFQSILSKSHGVNVRVKAAVEQYSSTNMPAVYPARTGWKGIGMPNPLAGLPAEIDGRQLYHTSQRDKAINAAYFKFCLQRAVVAGDVPSCWKMTDHEIDLVNWAIRNEKWTGYVGGGVSNGVQVNRRALNDMEQKALLDDSTSGGIEIAPIVFDDDIILLPVLYGELFPNVNLKTLTRGRRVKGGAMGMPSFTSGVAEGTPITPFTTTGFITAFDTTIYNAVGAMEIGQDFEEDSPVDVGGTVSEYFGLKALEWLDRVIVVGNGTTEPTGFFNASGVVVVNSDNGAGGPVTISDHEGLMFALSKAFRAEPGAFPCFVSNDQMYRKFRGIPVGPGDERRVNGMDETSYTGMQSPWKVQNDIPLGKISYCNLRRYRMYRRLGLTVRVETLGKTLALANTKMIIVRMRFGGQPETGGAFAIMTDAMNV